MGLIAETALAAPARTDPNEEIHELAPVEVTGSLIKRAEVAGPLPVKIITREEIEFSIHASLSELMAELPEVGFNAVPGFGQGISESIASPADGWLRGASGIGLHGFGVGNTLVLVDGRRAITGGASWAGTAFVDLNRYPIAMIERVEIVPNSGAIYGSGGAAGVVNIILRKDFSGAEVTARYGNSFRTDVAERSVAITTGRSDAKSNLTASVSYSRRGALRAADTSFARDEDLSDRYAAKGPQYAARVASGAFDLRSPYGPIAQVWPIPGQYNGQNGVDIPGLARGAQVTRLPGTGGVSVGTLSIASVNFTIPAVVGTGGTLNAQAAATFVPRNIALRSTNSNMFNRQEYKWLVPAAERTGLGLSYRRDLAPNVAGYVRFGYQHNRSHTEYAATPFNPNYNSVFRVPRTNYWNPFGIDVAIYFAPVDMGPSFVDSIDKTGTFLAGVQGRVGRSWTWDTAYTFAVNRQFETYNGMVSQERLQIALARTTPDAYNVFGGRGFQNDPAVIAWLRDANAWGGESLLHAWDAKVSGELFALPSGPVGAALLTEVRGERAAEWQPFGSTGRLVGMYPFAERFTSRQLIEGAAAELRVPLVKRETRRLLYDSELSVAARFDNYDGRFNSGFMPFAGLRVQPVRSLTLRGSVSRNFITPALPQHVLTDIDNFSTGYSDPRRPLALTGDPFDGSGTSRLILGNPGNPDLRPAPAETIHVGFVWDVPARWLRGLTIDTTYKRIEQQDGIQRAAPSTILNNEVGGGTADFVIREPGTETYTNRTSAPIPVLSGPNGQTTLVAVGQTVTVPGRIRSIHPTFLNLRDQCNESWDFSVAYARTIGSLGRFRLRSSASYLAFWGQAVGSATMVNTAGRNLYPRVRMQSSISWRRGIWNASIHHNYIGPYGDLKRSPYVEVDPYSTVRAQVAWGIHPSARGWLARTRVLLGVDNLFDREPPLAPINNGYRGDMISRPQGRFFSAEVKKTY